MSFERQPKYNTPDDQHLREQFRQTETIETYGGKLELVDVAPPEPKTDTPVIVAPGWAANATVFEENIVGMAARGRRTLSLQNYHGIATNEVTDVPNTELRKAAALIETIDQKNLGRVDAVGHSEAGIYLTVAATAHPEKFRNIVLVNPAGMIGKDTPPRLAARFSNEIARQTINGINDRTIRTPILRSSTEAGKAVAVNPVQATKQVFAIANTQIPEMLKDLKKNGVNVGVIHTIEDRAFPMQRLRENASNETVVRYWMEPGTHNQIFLKPDRFSTLADNALSELEKSRTQ